MNTQARVGLAEMKNRTPPGASSCGWFFIAILTPTLALAAATGLEPAHDKLVVLTFDDSVTSHYSVVRPLLKR